MNTVINISGDGLSPVQLYSISWTNTVNCNQIIFLPQNGLENVICKMSSILFRPQGFNHPPSHI